MYTHSELMEVLGEADMAMISADFWFRRDCTKLLPKNIDDLPNHLVWKELLAYQNGWLACKNFYKIRD
jgi:hypothetical protein